MKKIELLAPAGNEESLKAAINAGADAIYMGGSRFGARAFAGNFTDEELILAINYAHLMDVKIYITANTIIKDDEINDFVNYIDFLYQIGVDAVIMQDLGMIDTIKKRIPDLEIHASTQMTPNTLEDVVFLQNMGISRVVLSRELTYQEIAKIKKSTSLEIEAFIHGALCVSYSGKCLFSSMNGSRSGNRGMCAQPCREQYKITLHNNTLSDHDYLFSTKDLNTIENLGELIDSGVDSFKIEGRMKRSEYVFAVTSLYRQAIDNKLKSRESRIDSIDIKTMSTELKKVFNRDFTKGYIGNDKGSKIMNHKFQKYLGNPVAKVIDYDKKNKRLNLDLLDDLHKGDGLNTGEFVGRIIKDGKIVDYAKKGEVVSLDSIKKFESDFIVYKTFDKMFMDNINNQILMDKKVPIKAEVEMKINEYPILKLIDKNGNIAKFIYKEFTQEATNKPTTRETIITQLEKMGDTSYYIKDITLSIDDNIFIPLKTLNLIRREAILILNQIQADSNKREVDLIDSLNLRTKRHERTLKKDIKWSVLVHNLEQFKALMPFDIDRIYVHGFKLYSLLAKEYPDKNIYYVFPPVIKEDDKQTIDNIFKNGNRIKALHSLIGYVGSPMIENGILDYPLNLLNSLSHNYMHAKELETTVTPEMIFSLGGDLDYIENIEKVEVPVYLYPKLMVSEYCPYKGENGKCKFDKCQLEYTQIINKNNDEFILQRSINCKTILYPTKPKQVNQKGINNFLDKGYCRFRIEFLKESNSDVINILNSYL